MDSGNRPDGERRRRTTRRSVLVADRVASVVIRVGGLGVVLAVLAILAFLLVVTFPLLRGARVAGRAPRPVLSAAEAALVADLQVDELGHVALALLRDGRAVAIAVEDGRRLSEIRAFPVSGSPATVLRRAPGSDAVVAGFADGTLRIGRAGFSTTFLTAADAPAAADLRPGQLLAESTGSVIERLPGGDLRRVVAEVRFEEPLPPTSEAPVSFVDFRAVGEDRRLAVLHGDGRLFVRQVTTTTDFTTGEPKAEVTSAEIRSPVLARHREPVALLVPSSADRLVLAFRDGTVAEIDPASGEIRFEAKVAEAEPTAVALATGEQTLVVADATGGLSGWFRIPDRSREGAFRLVRAHVLPRSAAPVRLLDFSQRSRILAAADEAGGIAVLHLTSERRLASLPGGAPAVALAVSPKADAVVAVGRDGTLRSAALDAPHPEASLRSLFRKVWYEGYDDPTHTWQSSSGSDDFEPKLGLLPLVFGTFKATLYALLFAVPIALLAAIYTSEFLPERLRSITKPAIEAMASLPSVVLGFLAALVLAPIVERNVLAVLAGLALVPLAALAAGHVLPLLPLAAGSVWRRRIELPLLFAVAILALFAGRPVSRFLEARLFAGEFSGWLDGRVGEAAPGLSLLAWPILLAALLVVDALFLAPVVRRRLRSGSQRLGAAMELFRFLSLVAVSFVIAPLAGNVLAAVGLDARAGFLGTYVQRNALLVGFAMGFAVIPIVYTVAEDALTAVPRSLRSASIGCGATRWQTATRIVLPVAVPGIFSAVMVGLGRAVGETMIVVMAAGNTPILDWNPFNGLRTLSATIAVEMPEAARGGTLYRTLFLAALVLFALTFVVNTLAEIVRQRFRKKALAL